MDTAAQRELWNERYSRYDSFYGYRPNDFLVQAEVMLRRGGRVLVVGDGEGRNGTWLAQKGHQVTSVELSPKGVEKALGLSREREVSIDAQVGDLAEWVHSDAAQGPWDAIVWIFVHLEPQLRRQVAEGFQTRLAPRGKLLMEVFTPAQLQLGAGGPEDDEFMVTRTEVQDDWSALDLDVRIVERRIFEGRGHQGLASVLQVLGQPKRA